MENTPDLVRRNEELSAVEQIAAAIHSERDFQGLFGVFARQLRRFVDYDAISLFVIGEDNKPFLGWVIDHSTDCGTIVEIDYPKYFYNNRHQYKHSAMYHAIQTGKSIVREDWSESTAFTQSAESRQAGLCSDAIVPLYFRDRLVGLMTLASRTARTYSAANLPLLEQMGKHLGSSLYNTQLLIDLEKRNAEIGIINEIAAAVSAERDLLPIFEVFTDQLGGLIDFDATSLYMLGEEGSPSHYWGIKKAEGRLKTHQVEYPPEYYQDHTIFRKRALYHVIQSGEPLIREDWRQPSPFAVNEANLASGMLSDIILPLYFRRTAIGVLTLASKRTHAYTTRDLPLLRQLAAHLGPALHNTRLLLNLEDQNRQLEDKNAELERFTYTVSHDLKSPLVTIKGFLGLLEQDAAQGNLSSLRADIQHITAAADQMHLRLDDLLRLSRIGRQINPPEDIELVPLVHEAVSLVAGQIATRGVQMEVAADLPTVHGDRVRLLEVWQNLIDNAVKFMGDQAAPHIKAGYRCDASETVFYVRDNGAGIEPRYQNQIFELFSRLDNEVEGTGIGLALVKRIVETHGGRIWTESSGRGQGCAFCFTLTPTDQD